MLNKDQLLQLGYEINPDPDQPGMYYWKRKNDTEVSFGSEAVAVLSAKFGELLDRLTGFWIEVGDIKATPVADSDADYTVAVEVQVTAESHEEAARFALDDLRDRSLQEWSMTVTNSSGREVVTVPGNPEEKAGGAVQVSLDGGVTYQNASNGVRLVYKDMPIPGDGYEAGELHVNATHEGLILDVWATREGLVLNENIGTSSQMATDIVARMVEAND